MFSDLEKKIKQKKIIIGIVGLGYVGLPLARTFCKNNIKVFGFDTDKNKINKLKKGISYINYFKNRDIKEMHKNFDCFSKFENISKCDAIILCLPTPIKKNKSPEMKYIVNSIKLIKKYLRYGQVLSLESTTYPGTSEEVILPYLKRFNLGKNFFLIYSPEREDPGNKKFSNDRIPKVVGGYTKKCLKIGSQLYKLMGTKIIEVSSIKVAEMTKLLENIYRSVNIGLVNELKMLCLKMNIDIFEIIDAAKTKPFGFHAFYPGPGYGGHCIPIDPFLLSWKAKKYNFQTKFIELSGKINEKMPKIICDKVDRILKNKKNRSCLIIGVAYKKNVDDMRESPSLQIFENLEKRKIRCDYYDPYIKEIKHVRKFNKVKKSIKLTAANIKKYDVVVLATDHDIIDYDTLKKHSSMIFDCRGRYSKNNYKNVQQV